MSRVIGGVVEERCVARSRHDNPDVDMLDVVLREFLAYRRAEPHDTVLRRRVGRVVRQRVFTELRRDIDQHAGSLPEKLPVCAVGTVQSPH